MTGSWRDLLSDDPQCDAQLPSPTVSLQDLLNYCDAFLSSFPSSFPSSISHNPNSAIPSYTAAAVPSNDIPSYIATYTATPSNNVPSSTSATPSPFNLEWLHERLVALKSAVPVDQLMDQLSRLFQDTPVDLESSLIDLLGLDDLEFIGTLLQHRSVFSSLFLASNSFRDDVVNVIDKINEEDDEDNLDMKGCRNRRQFTDTYRPSAQVTINTDFEKRSSRKSRKKNLRFNSNVEEDVPTTFTPVNVPQGKTQTHYPNVYATGDTQNSSRFSIYGTEYALPLGSERSDSGEYEQIKIPMSKTSRPRVGERTIAISDMEPWMRSVFPGYKSLNRVQSIVFPCAIETNENMLVCAPYVQGNRFQ